MSLEEKTKRYIRIITEKYYYKALEMGYMFSEVKSIGPHLYKINIGNMELTYMGTAEGTARLVGATGEIA